MEGNTGFDIYAGRDPKKLPLYTPTQASRILRIPRNTLRSWIESNGLQAPLLKAAATQPVRLSFLNMIETKVVDILRSKPHRLKLQRIRNHIRYYSKSLGTDHPLAHKNLETFAGDLFVRDEHDKLVNTSAGGQLAMKEILSEFLERVEYDADGLASKFFVFGQLTPSVDSPKVVAISPFISFGRPAISGLGVTVDVIADRFACGESVDEISRDYDATREEIEEALRFRIPRQAA